MSKDELVNGGANRTDLVKRVKDSFSEYNKLKEARAEINAGMGEIRARWKAWGLSVKGIKAGLSRAELEQDQRELFDESYDLAADALGRPIEIQGDFFEGEQFQTSNDDGDLPLDGDGEEQDHLSDEERASIAAENSDRGGDVQHSDGSEADLGKGMHFETEQEEGDAAISELMPETAKAKRAAATTH